MGRIDYMCHIDEIGHTSQNWERSHTSHVALWSRFCWRFEVMFLFCRQGFCPSWQINKTFVNVCGRGTDCVCAICPVRPVLLEKVNCWRVYIELSCKCPGGTRYTLFCHVEKYVQWRNWERDRKCPLLSRFVLSCSRRSSDLMFVTGYSQHVSR